MKKDGVQEAYEVWSAERTPENMSKLLRAMDPMIKSVSATHGVSGDQNVQWAARAYLARQIMDRYDPAKTGLSTFAYQTLQRVPRIAAKQRNVVSVPETSDYDIRTLRRAKEELFDVYGREPTDLELSDHTGIDPRRIKNLDSRYARPILAASHADSLDSGAESPSVESNSAGSALWDQYVVDALDPVDKKIHGWLSGNRPLSKIDIANKLGISPSAVTQRASRIGKELGSYDG